MSLRFDELKHSPQFNRDDLSMDSLLSLGKMWAYANGTLKAFSIFNLRKQNIP